MSMVDDNTDEAAETTITTTKKVKVKVADHSLIDANGAVVEDEESATGIRYKLLANGQTFDWQYDAAKPSARMLALFGAKTLATNETSQARNNAKGAASADEQIAAVRDRFTLIDSGTWVDRTREGGTVDLDHMAEAVCQVKINAGAFTRAEADATIKAQVRLKLEKEPQFLKTARQIPAVAQIYAALVGRTAKTVDDLVI